ncbi:hypothetical protein [Phyllobacterium sophorae]|uniref:Uncharacterized protein n=1 Tax=Phyllobacterium sophorae TaxID=1520277 RepID=A0A2P7BDX3_9HYPH|nr:hypothetical protein [Phyllobacterium sophorae]PSH64652.1 hypothetical protein CU103_12270 [Phyllobacterium sophorae]
MAYDYIRYANQGATRNQPINPSLAKQLQYLKDLGLTMEVFSGGQEGEGPNRVGSHRHDHGNAADAFFYKGDRKLDWNNPEDRPIFEEIVRQGKRAGITGFGAGEGYMQPGSMHIGGGNPGVWGAGGKGTNAAPWLSAAYNGATPPPNPTGDTPQAPAQVAQASPEAPEEPKGLMRLLKGKQTTGDNGKTSTEGGILNALSSLGEAAMEAPEMAPMQSAAQGPSLQEQIAAFQQGRQKQQPNPFSFNI